MPASVFNNRTQRNRAPSTSGHALNSADLISNVMSKVLICEKVKEVETRLSINKSLF